MRISIIFMIAFLMMSIQVFSQDNKVTVKASNISLEELLWKIQRETDFVFVFSQKHVDGFDNLNVNVSGELEDVLNHILSDKGLTFVKRSNVYVIKKVEFSVYVKRFENISHILDMLQVTEEVNFKLENNSLVVSSS